MNDKVQRAFSEGVATDFGDQYFRTTPQLETGDSDLSWVNQTMFVGEGRFVDGFGLQYNMFRVG